MARTSRTGAPAANVDALDNLNLDDMFADGGDDLFDGLDIDLGNMDDITGSSAPMAQHIPAPQADTEVPAPEESPKRRKTKRKTKSRFFYDDYEEEDSEEPQKKKQKTTKPTAKKRSSKKAATATANDAPTKSQGTAKSKVKGKASATLPMSRTSSSSSVLGVAAAGQFGGRQKRGASFALPKSRTKLPTRGTGDTKSKTKDPASAVSAAEASRVPDATVAANLTQILSTHAGITQGPYCGLPPSNTLFYPFMPALPVEPTIKSRKVYTVMDRIHSSFLSQLQTPRPPPSDVIPASEIESIFRLVQEAYKDPPSASTGAPVTDRVQAIGNAIGVMRRTITLSDRSRVAGDLYALCALLKRQHDFLKQNQDNMEKWCKRHLSQEEYAAVYLPPKLQKKRKAAESAPSVLASFGKANIKVRIICPGFKEPKGSGTLIALLPPQFVPGGADGGKSAPKTKKRKVSSDTTKSLAASASVSREKTSSYPECKPARRRKQVSDTIARIARELESKYQQQLDDRKQIVSRQESDAQKLVAEDDMTVIHTTGMWRWLDKSGFLGSFAEKDVRSRLDSIRYPVPLQEEELMPTVTLNDALPPHANGSLVDRLASLLVEEDISDDTSTVDEIEQDSILYEYEDVKDGATFVDLSSLTVDERAALHLEAIGLADHQIDAKIEHTPLGSQEEHFESRRQTDPQMRIDLRGFADSKEAREIRSLDVEHGAILESSSDVEEVLHSMVSDLRNITSVNNNRAAFLESLALSSDLSVNDQKRKKDEDSAIIAKCQQLLKKNRESKVKPGKAKTAKNDEYALPW